MTALVVMGGSLRGRAILILALALCLTSACGGSSEEQVLGKGVRTLQVAVAHSGLETAPGEAPREVTHLTVSIRGTTAAGQPYGYDAPVQREGDSYSIVLAEVPVGTYEISAVATDAYGEVLFHTPEPVTCAVNSATRVSLTLQQKYPPITFFDHAPLISGLVASRDAIGGPDAIVHLSAWASDVDEGDELTFEWSSGEVGGTFTGQGTLNATWTPPEGFVGDATITFSATDTKGVRSALSVKVNVDPVNADWPVYVRGDLNHHPNIKSITVVDAQIPLGGATIASADVVDYDGDELSYLWSSDCGDFDDPHSRNPKFTHKPNDPPSYGPCKLVVAVEDGRGGKNEGTIIINVSNVRSAIAPQLLVVFQTPYVVKAGHQVAFMVFAVDPNGLPITYAWSDGSANGTFEFPSEPRSNVIWTPPPCPGHGNFEYRVTVRMSDSFKPDGAGDDFVNENSFTFPVVLDCPGN